MIKSRAATIRIFLTVAIALSIFLYFLCDYYLGSLGQELMLSWAKSEAAAVQEGNLLTSVTKSQPYLMASNYVRGVRLVEVNGHHVEPKISFGQEFSISPEDAQITDARVHLQRVGFLHSRVLYKIPNKNNFLLVFDLTSHVLNLVFFGSVSILVIIIFGLISALRRIEAIEAQKREKLLKLAVNDLVFRDANSEILNLEFPEISVWWNSKKKEIRDAHNFAIESQSKIRLGDMASCLVHDIKGPLRNISILTNRMSGLDEKNLKHLKDSIQKISDLTTRVSATSKEILQSDNSGKINTDISTLVADIAQEKSKQFAGRMILDLQIKSGPVLCFIDPIEFERSLGNLIDNSIEASSQMAIVQIVLEQTRCRAEITIKDNGCGILSENIHKIGTKGFTFGKEQGTGLGLFYAKRMVEECGGSFSIQSTPGQGTIVRISLPVLSVPQPTTSELKFKRASQIVLVDDCELIYQSVKLKLSPILEDKSNGIDFIYFQNVRNFENWLSVRDLNKEIFTLMDYHFEGEQQTGLDIIEAAGIANNSILVTAAPEDEKLKTHASRLAVPVLGKEQFAEIMIHVE